MNHNIRYIVIEKVEDLRIKEVKDFFYKKVRKLIDKMDVPPKMLISYCQCDMDDFIIALSYNKLWYNIKKNIPQYYLNILDRMQKYMDNIDNTYGEEYYGSCLNKLVVDVNRILNTMYDYPHIYGFNYDIDRKSVV